MDNKKIKFDGKEFKTSAEISEYTEKTLMMLQDLFLIAREEKHIRRMFKYIKRYAKSILIKHFKSYIMSLKDLNRRAYLVAEEVIIQYYKRPEFKIYASFGGYIKHKTRQIVFSRRYSLDSCSNYITVLDKKMEIEENKLYILPKIDEIITGSFRLYISIYNNFYEYWEDFILIVKDDNRKNIFSLIIIYKVDLIIDYKACTFFVKVKNFDIKRMKLKVEFKVRQTIKGTSLDKTIKVRKKDIYKTVTLGDIIKVEDLDARLDKNIEKFDTYSIIDHIIKTIDETSKSCYCVSRKVNLHRLIALRNRLLFGEEKADEFFKLFSKEAKLFYEQTLQLIYKIIKENIDK